MAAELVLTQEQNVTCWNEHEQHRQKRKTQKHWTRNV